MRSPARRPPSDTTPHARLSARIEALEERVRRLEALVRQGGASAGRPAPRSAPPPVSSSRPRPRCPGCTLELPRGRRGQECVWCGFHFAAVRPRGRRG